MPDAKEQRMSETPTASGMAQGESGVGGDPLDLVGAVGTDDDAMPGARDGAESGDGSAEDATTGDKGAAGAADRAPESGATLDPQTMSVDPDTGSDPLDDDAEGIRTPGIGGSGSSSDPMPDMSGTSG
jgi:hypothetical protein